MTIRVELFGIPRWHAGVDEVSVLPARCSASLAEVLEAVGAEIPGFTAACLNGSGLREGLVANVNGDRFERNLESIIRQGETLLILSADAGG